MPEGRRRSLELFPEFLHLTPTSRAAPSLPGGRLALYGKFFSFDPYASHRQKKAAALHMAAPPREESHTLNLKRITSPSLTS